MRRVLSLSAFLPSLFSEEPPDTHTHDMCTTLTLTHTHHTHTHTHSHTIFYLKVMPLFSYGQTYTQQPKGSYSVSFRTVVGSMSGAEW